MSLVLDALKKLERDRETSPPGVLVVGAVPWQGVRRRHSPFFALTLAGLLALAALALGAWWLNRTTPAPAGAPSRAAASGVTVAPPAEQTAPAATAPPAAAGAPSPPLATTTLPSAPPERRLRLPGEVADAAPAASGPRQSSPPPRGGPQLNAISQQDGRPVAVIDGRLVREGDSVGGVRILRIGETEVEVEVHGQPRTLRF